MRRKILLVTIVVALVAGNVLLFLKYFGERNSRIVAESALVRRRNVEKILDFFEMFVAKVLRAEQEVDFETRLQLENKVRELNNKEIMEQWQKFVDSKTEADAQKEVTKLLEILIKNIKDERG